MLALLILPLLVSGFIVCHSHPYYYYKLHRQQGQYLYLHAARLGLRCFWYGFLLNVGVDALLHGPYLGWLNPINFTSDELVNLFSLTPETAYRYAWAISVSLTAVFLMPPCWTLSSKILLWYKTGLWSKAKQKPYILSPILEDSPLDSFLFTALAEEDMVLLTMEDRKVYVGMVLSMGEPSETSAADQEIVLRPMVSGYRCKDHLKVTFTTPYEDVEKDLRIVLRQANIVSAFPFNKAVYDKFQEHKHAQGLTPACCEDTVSA